jgi:hypothetical protein
MTLQEQDKQSQMSHMLNQNHTVRTNHNQHYVIKL